MMKREPQQSQDFPDSFFRVSIKGLCVREGKVLMAHEHEDKAEIPGGAWELPGGGMDFDEEPQTALKREIKEEMGLSVTSISDAPTYMWSHKFEGQRGLDWYYALVIAYTFELESLNITPSKECEKIEFFSKEQLQEITVGYQMVEFVELFDAKDFT